MPRCQEALTSACCGCVIARELVKTWRRICSIITTCCAGVHLRSAGLLLKSFDISFLMPLRLINLIIIE